MALELTSPAFAMGEAIPKAHGGDGADRSPPLCWTGPPRGTVTFALVVEDPDAPEKTWVHWLAWNIPGQVRSLDVGVAPEGTVPQGTNDFGRRGYGGPKPPRGRGAHRYRFLLFALDRELDLAAGASRAELEARMEGHVLDRAALVGRYWRTS